MKGIPGFPAGVVAILLLASSALLHGQANPSAEQLAKWLKRFPEADANKDGALSIEEALAYRDKVMGARKGSKGNSGSRGGAPRQFEVDPRWETKDFPESAVSLQSPEKILEIYGEQVGGKKAAVTSFPKQENGVLRIVGTGHSFMAPGYRTLPTICKGAGFEQPLLTHIGGGITGSARYKWEQENGIFQFDGKPVPKLLASIANAEWDAMMWGPYFNDRPEYYTCWIEFCLQYHPKMKFYLSDAWPQLFQLGKTPESEKFFTDEVFDQMNGEKLAQYGTLLEAIRERTIEDVYILPTSNAMTIAAKRFLRGELPGIEGVHRAVGGKERSLWRDVLGHLGPGFDRLEGYVFYATLYGKSPVLIEGEVPFKGGGDFPSGDLDRIFREIAWEAVIQHPLSGIKDEDSDGVADPRG